MRATRLELENELLALEQEIANERVIRERATYRLEQKLREKDRVGRHLVALEREESNPERRSA